MIGKWAIFAMALSCFTLAACSGRAARSARETPLPPGVKPDNVVNAGPARPDDLHTSELALHQYHTEQRRAGEPPHPKRGEKYDTLVLSGLGSRSMYTFGVVCGWADAGTMPEFQVITGVGTGSFAAALLFGGKEYLADLRRVFLAADQSRLPHGDLWDFKRFPHPFGIGTDSVATTTKIHGLLRPIIDDAYFAKVAAEHAKGRRLYIGTTNLDTQRFVKWDMGAIASECTPESRKLFEDILVAATAMPPLLQPSRICVTIDGKQYEEMHVDGGTTRSLFWYPPSDWPGDEEDRKTGYKLLAGARVHVVMGDKVYNDPRGTKTTLGDVSIRGMKAGIFALHRNELARLYTHCLDRDMTLRFAAIPEDYGPMYETDVFEPAKTRKMFWEGYTRGFDGRAWDDRPPVRAVGEERIRRGTVLSTMGSAAPCGVVAPIVPIER